MAELIQLHLPKQEIAVARGLILNGLKERDLYDPNLIYRGFGRHLLPDLAEYGSEGLGSWYIYGNSEPALFIDPDRYWENPLSYALYGRALAVYRGELLIPEDYTTYRFKDLATKKNALRVIFSF